MLIWCHVGGPNSLNLKKKKLIHNRDKKRGAELPGDLTTVVSSGLFEFTDDNKLKETNFKLKHYLHHHVTSEAPPLLPKNNQSQHCFSYNNN